MSLDLGKFSESVRLLKNADPRAFDKFVSILETYVDEITVAVTDAPPDRIFIVQGQAQMARKLLRMFTETRESSKPTP